MLNTVKDLFESKSYLSVVDILKETLRQQNGSSGLEIPNYQIMTRYNQYIYMLNSLLELKNYYVCIIYKFLFIIINLLKLLHCTFYIFHNRNYLVGVNDVYMKLYYNIVKVSLKTQI